jgi:hypothetical protein
MEKEAAAIRSNCLRMAWHMRGGADYEQILQMSIQERDAIGQLIKDNIETTNKTRLPWF